MAVARNLKVTHHVDSNVEATKGLVEDIDNNVKVIEGIAHCVDQNTKTTKDGAQQFLSIFMHLPTPLPHRVPKQ